MRKKRKEKKKGNNNDFQLVDNVLANDVTRKHSNSSVLQTIIDMYPMSIIGTPVAAIAVAPSTNIMEKSIYLDALTESDTNLESIANQPSKEE
ncbi:MAG: hypothetical protein NC116_09625 [Clostridium sp.]|nr:hypothetical protein [Clostridium sp.]